MYSTVITVEYLWKPQDSPVCIIQLFLVCNVCFVRLSCDLFAAESLMKEKAFLVAKMSKSIKFAFQFMCYWSVGQNGQVKFYPRSWLKELIFTFRAFSVLFTFRTLIIMPVLFIVVVLTCFSHTLCHCKLILGTKELGKRFKSLNVDFLKPSSFLDLSMEISWNWYGHDTKP